MNEPCFGRTLDIDVGGYHRWVAILVGNCADYNIRSAPKIPLRPASLNLKCMELESQKPRAGAALGCSHMTAFEMVDPAPELKMRVVR